MRLLVWAGRSCCKSSSRLVGFRFQGLGFLVEHCKNVVSLHSCTCSACNSHHKLVYSLLKPQNSLNCEDRRWMSRSLVSMSISKRRRSERPVGFSRKEGFPASLG